MPDIVKMFYLIISFNSEKKTVRKAILSSHHWWGNRCSKKWLMLWKRGTGSRYGAELQMQVVLSHVCCTEFRSVLIGFLSFSLSLFLVYGTVLCYYIFWFIRPSQEANMACNAEIFFSVYVDWPHKDEREGRWDGQCDQMVN